MTADPKAQPERQPPPADPRSGKLETAKVNLKYLALGSGAAVAPASLTTRSMLTTARYISVFTPNNHTRRDTRRVVCGMADGPDM